MNRARPSGTGSREPGLASRPGPSGFDPARWETATGSTYVLTDDDVENGLNKLGMRVGHIPLNVTLCGFCDQALPADGRCVSCRTLHVDAALTEVHGDPLLKRRAA